MDVTNLRFETLAIHAGQAPDPTTGAVMQPIVLSSTYTKQPGMQHTFEYARSDNPTRRAAETCIAALEAGKHAMAMGSGCAATMTVLHTLRPGDHVIASDDVYGGTFRLLDRVFAPMGIETTWLDLTRLDQLEAAFRPNTRILWLETPSNPMLKVIDIAASARIAHARGAKVVVDNTFASPMLQRPLDLGADIVLHSTTKYINGHSDVVSGALITRDDAIAEQLRFLQNALGAVPSPFDCYLILRGLKTLPIRMERHCQNASRLAAWLEKRSEVERVYYPGLSSHPQHALASTQMKAPGGMISFVLRAGVEATRKVIASTRVFTLAESLGGVESLIEHPATMTHGSLPREVRERIGISDGLVRASVGLEAVEDLEADLAAAFRVLGSTRS